MTTSPISKCPTCEKLFASQRAMSGHHKSVHGESLHRVTVECATCGEAIERHLGQLERTTRSYCSRACQNEGLSRFNSVTVECAHCGTRLRRAQSRCVGEQSYCDQACYMAERRGESPNQQT